MHAILDRELGSGSWVPPIECTVSVTSTSTTRESVLTDANARGNENRKLPSTGDTGLRNPLQTVEEEGETPEKVESTGVPARKVSGDSAESLEALRRELNNSLRAKEELERNFKAQTAELALLRAQSKHPQLEVSMAEES